MPWNTRAPSWTDPTGGKGGQPNFRFDRQSGSHLGNMRDQLVGQNQLGIATQQALGSVAQMMQKYKQDKIAEALTQRDAQNFGDPEALNRLKQMGLSGADARNQFLADMKFNLSRKDAQDQQKQWDEEGRQAETDKYYKNALNEAKLQSQYDGDPGDKPKSTFTNSIPIARGWLNPKDQTFTNDPMTAGKQPTEDASQGDYIQIQTPGGKKQVVRYQDFVNAGGQDNPQNVPQKTNSSSIPTISSPDEASKLPSGTKFYDPSGVLRTVP